MVVVNSADPSFKFFETRLLSHNSSPTRIDPTLIELMERTQRVKYVSTGWCPISAKSIVIIILERDSPDNSYQAAYDRLVNDGKEQVISVEMVIRVIQDSGLNIEVHPFVCRSHNASRHQPVDCPGIYSLVHILLDPIIQKHEVIIIARTSNRYGQSDDFAGFLQAGVKAIHPNCTLRAADGYFHDIVELRRIDCDRVAANGNLDGNHKNVTQTLERSDENEEKQADIYALRMSLKKDDPASLLPMIESACNHNGVLSEDHWSRLRTYRLQTGPFCGSRRWQ